MNHKELQPAQIRELSTTSKSRKYADYSQRSVLQHYTLTVTQAFYMSLHITANRLLSKRKHSFGNSVCVLLRTL